MTVTTPDIPVAWWDRFVPPDNARAEIIMGELVLSPTPSKLHALVVRQLMYAFDRWAPQGYVALTGVEWRLAGEVIVAQAPVPDVVVIPADTDLIQPLLAVEVISPSDLQKLGNGLRRIEGKRLDYADHGLSHYLEVELENRAVTRYHREDGQLVAIDRCYEGDSVEAHEPFRYSIPVGGLFGV